MVDRAGVVVKTAAQLRELGYPTPHARPIVATAYRIKRIAATGVMSHPDSFTTHLRGPSPARPTSGIGYLPTKAWMDVNAEKYGIVRHKGSI